MCANQSKDTSQTQLDINKKFGKIRVVKLDEYERLKFAKQLLLVLGLICISVFVGYAFLPENKALIKIFELVKIGMLPLATLVVSFYFSYNRD